MSMRPQDYDELPEAGTRTCPKCGMTVLPPPPYAIPGGVAGPSSRNPWCRCEDDGPTGMVGLPLRQVYEVPLPLNGTFPAEVRLDLEGVLLGVVTRIEPTPMVGPDGKPRMTVTFALVVEGREGQATKEVDFLLTLPGTPIPDGFGHKQVLWLPDRYLLVYTREVAQ